MSKKKSSLDREIDKAMLVAALRQAESSLNAAVALVESNDDTGDEGLQDMLTMAHSMVAVLVSHMPLHMGKHNVS